MAKKHSIVGPDGLPAPEVGPWVEKKHKILREYLRLHAGPRRHWLKDPRQNGAAYIDLFCGAGMARIEGTDHFVDGSPVVAWNSSNEDKAPFTKIVIADKDAALRSACAARLRKLNAPVVEVEGSAADAAHAISEHVSEYGLNVAFLDPFSLGQLNIELFRALAKLKYIDILAHVSAMDLFRNFPAELTGKTSEFDEYAPGWREHVPSRATDDAGRRAIFEHWKKLVRELGLKAEPEVEQIRNSVNRDIYWLMLIARHGLATKFWQEVRKYETPQTGFPDF